MKINYVFSVIIITSLGSPLLLSSPYKISAKAGKPAIVLSEGDAFIDDEKNFYEIVSIEDCQSNEGTRFLMCRLRDSHLSLHKKYISIEQGPIAITKIKKVDSIEAFMSRFIELNLRKNYKGEPFIIKGAPHTLTEVTLDEKILDRTRPGQEEDSKQEIVDQSKRLFAKDKFIRADYIRKTFFWDDRVMQFASNNPPSNYETVSERYQRNYHWKRIISAAVATTVLAGAAYSFYKKIKRAAL